MAQGPTKKTTTTTTTSKRRTKPHSQQAKKGARTIAPKKTALLKAGTITKLYSAGLTAKTEGKLAARVGYLELVGGAKRGKAAKKGQGQGKGQEKKKGEKGGNGGNAAGTKG